MNDRRRANGQFDDTDDSYNVEILIDDGFYTPHWQMHTRNVTLRNGELLRRSIERKGAQARVRRHQADEP